MKREIAMATRVARDKEGNGNGSKSDGSSNKVGRQATASRLMAMAMATHGRWQWQKGWWVTKRARVRTRVARAMETMMRVVQQRGQR